MKDQYPHKVKWHERDEDELLKDILECYVVGTDNLGMGLDAFEGKSIIDKVNDWQATYNGRPIFEVESNLSPEDVMFLFKFAKAQLKNQLSIINQANIRAEYEAVGKDSMVSSVISEVYEVATKYYENKMGKKDLTLRSMLTAGIEGTTIEEVAIEKESYIGDVVVEYDPETGARTIDEVEEVRFNGPVIKLHRLHEFLIADPFEADVQKQPWVMLRKTITYSAFWSKYKGFPKSDLVKGGEYYFVQDSGEPDSAQNASNIRSKLENDEVEIVRFFRKTDNLYVIVANGVILYQGPILSRKVNYPFEKRIHEPVDGTSLFWGSAFMENMTSEQGLTTITLNLMFKKQMWSANPTLMTESEEDMFDGDKLEIGLVRKVSDIMRTKVLQFPGVDGGDMNFVNTMREALQNNSNQAQGGGSVTAPGGGTGTARQVVTAQEQAMRVIGLNATYLEECERRIKTLFLDLIREYLTTPEIEKITKADGSLVEKSKYDRTIRVKNQKLNGGKRGTALIHFYSKKEYYDSHGNKITHKKREFNPETQKNEIVDTGEPKIEEMLTQARGQALEAEKQESPMDILYVPIELFDDFDYEVSVVPGSSSMDSKMLMLEERESFIQLITPFLGESINGLEVATFFAEVYNYDIDRFVKEQQEQIPPEIQAIQEAEANFDPMEEGAILEELVV